jgi:hypothetical protein
MYACPCCGYLTFLEEPPGTFDTCPVCAWVDDIEQFKNITNASGANPVSLKHARDNYALFGAITREEIKNTRIPKPCEHILYEQIMSTLPDLLYGPILKEAISLSPVQPYEVGWTKSSINNILTLLKNSNIAILGGDVYQCVSGEIKPAYANWHSEQRVNEDITDFAKRSREETFKYINLYEDPEDGSILYALVFK